MEYDWDCEIVGDFHGNCERNLQLKDTFNSSNKAFINACNMALKLPFPEKQLVLMMDTGFGKAGYALIFEKSFWTPEMAFLDFAYILRAATSNRANKPFWHIINLSHNSFGQKPFNRRSGTQAIVCCNLLSENLSLMVQSTRNLVFSPDYNLLLRRRSVWKTTPSDVAD